jgi:hypothetical protein
MAQAASDAQVRNPLDESEGLPWTQAQAQALEAGLEALEAAEQALVCAGAEAPPDRPTPMSTLRPRAPI